MATIRRILGKRGRTTIPYDFRQILDMRCNDVLTFAMNDDRNCVIITKEKICDDCIKNIKYPEVQTVFATAGQLNREDKLRLITVLLEMLVENPGGEKNAS